MTSETPKITPMMAQWHECKTKAKEAVLLFRMGDFYEAFYEDAATLSKEVDLTLTQRQGIPMAGIPHHSAEGYIDKLIQKGFRVAIAEQTEDPKSAKGLVKREIVRIITPGTVIQSNTLLSEKLNNFLASISQIGSLFGFSYIDLTTGDFKSIEVESISDLHSEIGRVRPAEIILTHKFHEKHRELLNEINLTDHVLFSLQEEWHFDHELCHHALLDHFRVQQLDCFGLKGMVAAINASGALINYLKDNLPLNLCHIQSIKTYSPADYLSIDPTTQKNLELLEPLQEGSRKTTFLSVLDKTQTPMGARLMRRWIMQPLQSLSGIEERQDAIESMLQRQLELAALGSTLGRVRDLERLMMRVATNVASPKDLVALKLSLGEIPSLKNALTHYTAPLIQDKCKKLRDFSLVVNKINEALVDEPPQKISDCNLFRDGFNSDLDELRSISRDGKSWLLAYQTRLREETGIKTLKVSYTAAFGYYIEVSHGQAGNMPATFQRRQTLVNNERFISKELKEYEEKVLSAEDRILRLEQELFGALRSQVATELERVFESATAIAEIDCLYSLSEVARAWHFVRPKMDHSQILSIIEGRHPVIESSLANRTFTPNDSELGTDNNSLVILTGPNMAGKSTYIRQVALIAIMAHMGSFVPAKSAHIGLIDKIFTRIGASDDLSRGQSTFMVEMSETANILHNVTQRSLVILDEIGRGTSTYDGIAIAWSVAEFLLTHPGKQAKTLFATHYWELTKLEERDLGAVNYNVAVQETSDGIVFLHKIIRGGTDKSYGIHVAKLAGLPSPVIDRAKEILNHLEEGSGRRGLTQIDTLQTKIPVKSKAEREKNQLFLFA